MRQLQLLIFFLFGILISAQAVPSDTIRTENRPNDSIPAARTGVNALGLAEKIEAVNKKTAAPGKLNPTRAGLFSAIVPGLGQYYNKKYWKIPVVYGLVGTGVGFTLYYQKQFTRYRNAFVAQLNGQPHEFSNLNLTDMTGALGRQQDRMKRQRDYAIGLTALAYILNILDAIVDAQLYEGRNDPELAFRPVVISTETLAENRMVPGVGLQFKF